MTRRGKTARLFALLVVAVVLVGVAYVFGVLRPKPYRFPSASMAPTLAPGDRIVTTEIDSPQRGDIVVLKRSSVNFVRRVLGREGDRVAIRRGRVVLNGRLQSEPYITPDLNCGLCNRPRAVRVPEGRVFVMADNRGTREDSRLWGPVSEDAVAGKVRFRYWPVSRIGSP